MVVSLAVVSNLFREVGVKRKKVYRGWIDPKDLEMVRRHIDTNRPIHLNCFSYKAVEEDRPCKITVEWAEKDEQP